MKITRVAVLMALAALASCSEADVEKAPKAEEVKEVSLVGYWEDGLHELDGKHLYLQFTQDGLVTHNNSYMSSQTKWMLTERKNMIIFTTSPNDRQYKCDVELSHSTLIVLDAGCLPGYFDVTGMKGKVIHYSKM